MQPGQHVRDMEEQLRLALGAKVEIKQSAKGRGRITIHFASHEEFERLRAMLVQTRRRCRWAARRRQGYAFSQRGGERSHPM